MHKPKTCDDLRSHLIRALEVPLITQTYAGFRGEVGSPQSPQTRYFSLSMRLPRYYSGPRDSNSFVFYFPAQI